VVEDDPEKKFYESSLARWQQLISALPKDHPGRLLHGSYSFSEQIAGNVKTLALAELLEKIRSLRKYTGLSPFWVPTREGIAPMSSMERLNAGWAGMPVTQATLTSGESLLKA
jgi:hypothetical protein